MDEHMSFIESDSSLVHKRNEPIASTVRSFAKTISKPGIINRNLPERKISPSKEVPSKNKKKLQTDVFNKFETPVEEQSRKLERNTVVHLSDMNEI